MAYILDSLYHGELNPLNEPVEGSRYGAASAAWDRAEQDLERHLGPEGLLLLARLSEAHQRALSSLERDAFVQGFRLGGRLAAEMLR